MRSRAPFRKAAVFGAVTIVLFSVHAPAITVAPPPPRDYVCQTWIGFSMDDRDTIRIEFKANGTGAGLLLDSINPPDSFEITAWSLDDYALNLTVRFDNPQWRSSTIAGSFKEHLLSYMPDMLTNADQLSANWLPGPLQLVIQHADRTIRFGACQKTTSKNSSGPSTRPPNHPKAAPNQCLQRTPPRCARMAPLNGGFWRPDLG